MTVTKKKAVKKKVMRKKRISAKPKLTVKQSLFVKEYLADLNATQAAIRAGYSEKTAKEIGHENLTKPHIAAVVAEAMSKRSEKAETSAEYVLDRLYQEAEADIADLYNKDGSLKSVHEWPVIWRKGLVFGVDVIEMGDGVAGKVTKLKISDRVKRLEMIGKHHAMFTNNVNLGGNLAIKNLTDEELDSRVEELQAKLYRC